MNKVWSAIKAFFCAIFVLIFVTAVIIGSYIGLEWAWDYALVNFGDKGFGFMFCFSCVMVILGVFWLIKSFYKDFVKKGE